MAELGRDEYPPAFARSVSSPTPSIRLIDPGSNRALGAYIERQTRGLDDHARFYVRVVP